MYVRALTAAAILLTATSAYAGLGRWSVEAENDPFSGGQRVTVDYMASLRSGVLIICDSSEHGLTVRAIPGFAFTDALSGYKPTVEFAIDGSKVLGQEGRTGSVGDNIAVAETLLSPENARTFVDAFAKASKQVAIKDGISDRPHLLTAAGSTKAGAALVACMDKQGK